MKATTINELLQSAGKLSGIYAEEIHLHESFVNFAARFASAPGTVILLSGGDLDCARFHILAARPWLRFSGRNQNLDIYIDNQVFKIKADPFDALREIVKAFALDGMDVPEPVQAGLFGYLAYDLKDRLEELPRTVVDDLRLPHICFFAPSILVVHDKETRTTRLLIPKRAHRPPKDHQDILRYFNEIINAPAPQQNSYKGDATGFSSNFKQPAYQETITTIKEYIAAGHVYQVNMSQRFMMDFAGDPYRLFQTLFDLNPAPFFAYINAGDHQVVSTSPERFIQQQGRIVETRPIKGTRPRGKTVQQDARFRCELEQSPKDDAELSMIVDLLRNDLGKVCEPGSVTVAEHKRLEAYQNVYHLVSRVTGRLSKQHDAVDLIKAVFPGGSITGCPKIRAMQIIDELEPCSRHVYTGAMGYISFHESMDLNIAIRTAVVHNQKILFSAGGGIVFDSDPAEEFQETLHKGISLMSVFKENTLAPRRKDYAWVNGILKPVDQARIPITAPGFQYGFGFFETIAAKNGACKHLKAHIRRFNRTWKCLFGFDPPGQTWDIIIRRVLEKNGLSAETAAVKIIAAKGERDKPPSNYILVVSARPYTHRLRALNTPGLHLATYGSPRQSPLADHKTLNYLYYHLAGEWAKARGAHEALILNPDETVSETNTANILIIKDKTVLEPDSPHVLPGIMQQAVLQHLKAWGYALIRAKVKPRDITADYQVILTNALMGAAPVLGLDGRRTADAADLCKRLNALLR